MYSRVTCNIAEMAAASTRLWLAVDKKPVLNLRYTDTKRVPVILSTASLGTRARRIWSNPRC